MYNELTKGLSNMIKYDLLFVKGGRRRNVIDVLYKESFEVLWTRERSPGLPFFCPT